jgi:hypothetical protein
VPFFLEDIRVHSFQYFEQILQVIVNFILFRYRIPEGLTHDDVTSDLSADGVLVVKAHKAQAA